jgi:diaminopimelate decarboxylase
VDVNIHDDRHLTVSSPLPAVERRWATALRESPVLWDIAHAIGGPFHVLHTPTFAQNLAAMIAVLDRHRVNGVVYYGKKANKGAAWLRECAVDGAGVDVASAPEMTHCLGNGIRGEQIVVTGASKTDALLWLAARHGALMTIDAADELERLLDAAVAAQRVVDIVLRVRPPQAPHSRFGLTANVVTDLMARCAQRPDLVRLRGFSFHLDGYAPTPRAELAHSLIELCRDARADGHPVDRIDMGGGIAVDYVTASDWERFSTQMRPEWFHNEHRPRTVYPYHQAPAGAAMVDAILDHQHDGVSLAEKLRADNITLLLEPGRALVNGAGFSVFPVQGFKPGVEQGFTVVNGLSMSLSEQWKGSEFLPDPILVRRDPDAPGSPVRTAVGGSSCLEYDVLTWRRVQFPVAPRPGDLLVYPNTAGYQMDKNESTFHQLPLPPKVVVDDQLRWRLDETGPGAR